MNERRINMDAAIMAAAHTQVGESASAAGILAGQIVARDRIIAQLRARLAAVEAVCDTVAGQLIDPDEDEWFGGARWVVGKVRAALTEGAGE